MKTSISYLFLEKTKSLDSQSEIQEFARRCADNPKQSFVKTACYVYQEHYDFIYIAEAYGFRYQLPCKSNPCKTQTDITCRFF